MIFITIGLLLGLVGVLAVDLRRLLEQERTEHKDLKTDYKGLEKKDRFLRARLDVVERKAAIYFFYYDLAKKIAPYFDRKKLKKRFSEELQYLGDIEAVSFANSFDETDTVSFSLGENEETLLGVKINSPRIVQFLPHFGNLLRLCLDRIRLYETLQQLSIYDSLTGCYNRRYFMYRFGEEFERAKKFNLKLSFLMIDIDWFKQINDTHGHLVGDVVLKEVARIISETIRGIDFVARFGGEEFGIILLETDQAGAIMVAQRICSTISAARIKAFDEIVATTVSVGVSTFPDNVLGADDMIELSDGALYQAKNSGRNRVCWQ